MKKILIGLLMVLLVFLAYFTIYKGISFGNLEVLSISDIQEENNKLTEEIAQTETLMQSGYRSKTDELEKGVSDLLAAKNEYLDLAEVSTDKDLQQANKEETYNIEYLWTKIGSHATAAGIDIKLDVVSGDSGSGDLKNLNFSLTGNYIAIINFVISIEDDSGLGFSIENFKILPGSGTDGRQATFTIRNVRIKQESASEPTTPADTTTTDDNAATAQPQSDENTNAAE